MRLIDADENSQWAEEHILDAKERYAIIDFLRDCSTVDAVPVVRCKDCVYFELDKENADLDNWYHLCQNLSCGVKKMDYCSFGERRSD